MRRALTTAAVVAIIGTGASAAAAASGSAAAVTKPSPAKARLQGRFKMAGVVTSASGVSGVHVGDRVSRVWTFTPVCAIGACPKVTLVRTRRHGSDTVTLKRKSAGLYTGSGSFYAALGCGSRTYGHGWLVPFKVQVKVTGAALVGGAVVATRVKATFVNSSRQNETPCVVPPAHDAARYSGKLL